MARRKQRQKISRALKMGKSSKSRMRYPVRNSKKRARKRQRKIQHRRTRIRQLTPIQNAAAPYVSVIIPVMNERRTIASVIHEAARVHPAVEVIVVANGSQDGTNRIAEAMGARVIHYAEPLGHDVGRAIGAKHARGSILLFTDGDLIIPAADFKPLIQAIEHGADVALNQYIGPVQKKKVHSVILAKHALNIVLSRPDLKGYSMTTIPHALSRKAIEQIGLEHLAVPPLAQAIAAYKGLTIVGAHYIQVGSRNPRKRQRENGIDPLETLIVGDHLEAIRSLLQHTNGRGNFTDLSRLREKVRW